MVLDLVRFVRDGYNRHNWLVSLTFPVCDGRREAGPITEPGRAARRSRQAWLRKAAAPCRVDGKSASCAFYSSTWQIKVRRNRFLLICIKVNESAFFLSG